VAIFSLNKIILETQNILTLLYTYILC